MIILMSYPISYLINLYFMSKGFAPQESNPSAILAFWVVNNRDHILPTCVYIYALIENFAQFIKDLLP